MYAGGGDGDDLPFEAADSRLLVGCCCWRPYSAMAFSISDWFEVDVRDHGFFVRRTPVLGLHRMRDT